MEAKFADTPHQSQEVKARGLRVQGHPGNIPKTLPQNQTKTVTLDMNLQRTENQGWIDIKS